MEREEKQAAIVITLSVRAELSGTEWLWGIKCVVQMAGWEQKRGSIRGPVPGDRVHSDASNRD